MNKLVEKHLIYIRGYLNASADVSLLDAVMSAHMFFGAPIGQYAEEKRPIEIVESLITEKTGVKNFCDIPVGEIGNIIDQILPKEIRYA